MNDDTNDFWQDVLGRVQQTGFREEAPEPMSLEEAERRMASAEEAKEEVASLSPGAVERMVASATRPRVGDVDRSGGKLFGFPMWSRRAVAAGLILAPLVAVAFIWQEFTDKNKPTIPYVDDPDAPLDYPTAMKRLANPDGVRQLAARHAALGEDIEQWALDFRIDAQNRVSEYIRSATRVLRQLRNQPGVLGMAAASGIDELSAALDSPVPNEAAAPVRIVESLRLLQSLETPPQTKTELLKDVLPQLKAGIYTVRRTLLEGGLMQAKGELQVATLRTELAR